MVEVSHEITYQTFSLSLCVFKKSPAFQTYSKKDKIQKLQILFEEQWMEIIWDIKTPL